MKLIMMVEESKLRKREWNIVVMH